MRLKAPAPMSRPTTSRSRSTPRSRSSGRCWSRASPAPARPCWRWRSPRASNAPLIEWHVKSTTKALQGLYEYDAVSRLRDSQLGDERVKRHPQLHQARQAVGRLRRRRAAGAADRRDRQGRHRISQRSAARTRSHGVLRLRDRRDGEGAAAADRDHHLQQREGAAGRVPAPLLLPLHPLSRRRHHAGDHRGAFPRHQAAAGRRRRSSCSTRCARCRA